MAFDLSKTEDRVRLIREIESDDNRNRKAKSLREYEIFKKRQKQYVLDYLKGQFSASTVKEMPLIHSIHLCTRIVKQQASLYQSAPERTFMNVPEQTAAQIKALYTDLKVNAKMKSLNEYFKLQDQAHLRWTIRNKKLKPQVMLPHHLDVVPLDDDPEVGSAYIVSSFDKTNYLEDSEQPATGKRGKGNRKQLAPGVVPPGAIAVTVDGKPYESMAEAARHEGISLSTLRMARKMGWTRVGRHRVSFG